MTIVLLKTFEIRNTNNFPTKKHVLVFSVSFIF